MDVTYVGKDEWSRDLYKSVLTGYIYVNVDGTLYDRTPDWEEPNSPLVKLDKVTIVSKKEPE